MKSKNSKSAFAILEVVVALALTLLVASVVFFYGRIIIENAKISKLKSDIDLTVSSIKNGFYSLYEKYPGMLSEEEIRSSFSDDKGTLSCSGAGTSDISCYTSTYFDRSALSLTDVNGNYCFNGLNAFTGTVMNAVNQLALSGNAPRGLINFSRTIKNADPSATSGCTNATISTWTSSLIDEYQIPFNSSFKGYWIPFDVSAYGFGYAGKSASSLTSGDEKTKRLAMRSNYYISIGGRNLSNATGDTYPSTYLTQNPILTKQQAYKFSQRFNDGVVIGYADSDYHLVKPAYFNNFSATGVISVSSSDYCNSAYSHSIASSTDTGATDTGLLSSVTIDITKNAKNINYGCAIDAKVNS